MATSAAAAESQQLGSVCSSAGLHAQVQCNVHLLSFPCLHTSTCLYCTELDVVYPVVTL